MAKVSQITVGDKNILNNNQRIDWTKFKNTPLSVVTVIPANNHDDKFYLQETVNSKFKVEEDRISSLELKIEKLAYKTDLMLGGGGSTGNAIHNYNLSTEVTSEITTTLNNSPLNTPGISAQTFGYFLNSNKEASKFDYSTLVNETIHNSPITPNGSMIDFAIQSKGIINDDNTGWAQLNTKLDTWASKDSTTAVSDGRTLLSSTVVGYQKKSGSGFVSEYSYSSGVVRNIVEFTTIGTTVGLNKSSHKGYWISKVNGNFEHAYTTDTVSMFNTMVNDADNASTSTTESFGYIVGGGSGLTSQKLNWSSLAITTCTNLSVNKNGASSIEQ